MKPPLWLAVATWVLGAVIAVAFLLAPRDVVDLRGSWVDGADTLRFTDNTAGTFRRESFTADARENRLCLRTRRHPDCLVVTVGGDSLVMTSGIATLLHSGDTVRVFRR